MTFVGNGAVKKKRVWRFKHNSFIGTSVRKSGLDDDRDRGTEAHDNTVGEEGERFLKNIFIKRIPEFRDTSSLGLTVKNRFRAEHDDTRGAAFTTNAFVNAGAPGPPDIA